MTRAALALLLGATLLAWPAAQTPPAQQRPPTFTANTDVVYVDVSVRKDGRQLTGLTAADFELRDNGVKQDIDTVEASAVPIDLSIVVDVSGNPDRPQSKHPTMEKVAAEVDADARKLVALLRPGDRVRLLAQDTYLQQIWPLQPATSAPRVERIDFDGQSSLYDTVTALLLQPSETTRRHVIVLATKGIDTISAIEAQDVQRIAAHADAQLHLVMQEKRADEEASIRPLQCGLMDMCRPAYRFWTPSEQRLFKPQPLAVPRPMAPLQPLPVGGPGMGNRAVGGSQMGAAGGTAPPAGTEPPVGGVTPPAGSQTTTPAPGSGPGLTAIDSHQRLTPDGVRLQAGAESTGGGLYQDEAVSEPTLYSVFAKAFENFRQSYVLRYSPKGVKRPGWHDITVTVPRDKSVVIHARNGYLIDAPGAAPPPKPPAPARLTSLADLMSAYNAGRYNDVDLAVSRLANPSSIIKEFDFTSGMNPFPGNYRAEAAFALDLGATAIFSRTLSTQEAGRSLLQRFSRLIRPPMEPDDYEHVWLTAVLALLQGRIAPTLAEPFVERALARFPNEPRFLLARAIVADQRWRGFGTMSFTERATPTEMPIKQGTALLEAYEAVAAASPQLATEARIRQGWFLYRVGRPDEALKVLDAAPPLPDDRPMEYLRHLFKSHIYTSQDKLDDAANEARQAHVILPEAQSARVALMNALSLKGDASGALTVAENIETAPQTDDPWWTYWLGDFRWYGAAREILRGMAR
jgi:tetratricopeptide (TPR) repeat protein